MQLGILDLFLFTGKSEHKKEMLLNSSEDKKHCYLNQILAGQRTMLLISLGLKDSQNIYIFKEHFSHAVIPCWPHLMHHNLGPALHMPSSLRLA